MTPFALAGLQLALQPTGNLDTLVRKVRGTLTRFPWIQMVVLSELACCGAKPKEAEALPSETESVFAGLARELGIWLVTGSLYERDGDKVYNTASVFDPAGATVARYRKMYPFYPYEKGVDAGSEICVFDVPGVGRFGVSICYDLWFPETSRALMWEGAEVLLHPTLTNTIDREVECAMVRAAAAQNQFYVIDVNASGPMAYGRSIFVGPEGEVLHEAGREEEIIVMEIDLDRVRRSRERGLLGLGQPLKSYRDARHRFPQEEPGNASAALDALGPLEVPPRSSAGRT